MTNTNNGLSNVAINLIDPVTGDVQRLTVLDSTDDIGSFLEENECSIVSLDADPQGTFGFYAIVALDDADPISETSNVAIATKLDIAMELDEMEEEIFSQPVTPSPTISKKEFKAKQSAPPAKKKVHTYLYDLIVANPGICRQDVFANGPLRKACGVPTGSMSNDPTGIKRYNRRLNRFLRQIRRDGHELTVVRTNNVASYTITPPPAEPDMIQLSLPFGETNNNVAPVTITRGDEEENMSLDFDALLATLDNEAVAPVA